MLVFDQYMMDNNTLMDTMSKDQIKTMVMIRKKDMMIDGSSKMRVMNSMDPYLVITDKNRVSVEKIRLLNLLSWDDWKCFIAMNDENCVGEQHYS